MKTPMGRLLHGWVVSCTVLLVIAAVDEYSCLADQPAITAIQSDGSNVVVEVSVPGGFERVTLEGRSRLGSGAWAPLAVSQNDGSHRTLRFRVSCVPQAELMRVRADAQQPLPAGFYQGTNSFSAPQDTGAGIASAGGGGASLGSGTPTGANGDPTRTVTESDIWEMSGDTLYFFNQYRGLQVIDITNPDTATVPGTLELPAAGEQMYLLDSNHVVLLANACGYGIDQSRLIVVAVSNDVPSLVTNLGIGGWVQDSRLVGTALYVASQSFQPVSGSTNSVWQWGTTITSFDLSNPARPATRGTQWFAGYGNVVVATDTYLFVATQDPTNWWQSSVQILDITAPDGTMSPAGAVRTAGQISDKFKLNYTNQVFTAISQNWRWVTGTGPITELETFYLPAPGSLGPGGISKLGELELGSGEQLHATQFDGDLVYVVTSFQIDPLWVVDLSDPANPHIAGSVNVPGWSTYLYPLGDRLVTLGVESNRVAVSLFDVHAPAQPVLLSRVLLGQNYSWSDANYDEKAFTVLPDQGLVLVPYNGDTTNGWTSQVQLLDLTPTNLVARGIIHHQCEPRRTAFSHHRILSLSGWELLSVDVTDHDQPAIKGDLELAWPVDQLLVAGDYLLELSASSGWWGYQAPASVRVTPLHQQDRIVNELTLGNLPIVGACLKDGLLYLAQSQGYPWLIGPAGGPGGGPGTNAPNFFVTILDASSLPKLAVLGQTSIVLDSPGAWGGNWTAVWPTADVLVWAGGGGYWPIFWGGGAIPAGPAGGTLGIVGGIVLWPWWGYGGGQLLAFGVSHSASPAFDSEVNLATNGWWSFSQPFCAGTLVYVSHNESEVVTNADNPNGLWMQKSLLNVIDYTDPTSPTLRQPASIPGTLQGISNQGELLYTVGWHWSTNQTTDWTQWLDASAYDGLSAHLVDSLALPDSWPHPLLLADTNVFIGRPGVSNTGTNVSASQLENWNLTIAGKFTLNASVPLDQAASTLFERSGLLAVQEADNSVQLFDVSSPGALVPVARTQPSWCLWYDLTKADGGLGQGLWIPLGAYGIEAIGTGP